MFAAKLKHNHYCATPMKIPMVLLLIVGIPLILWTGWGLYITLTTEQPEYEVKQRLPSRVELRHYDEQHWISTPYNDDDASFMVLGSYIFGKNETGEKVAMTAPVITDENMTFILPEGVSPENAPTPAGQSIDFTTVPARTIATIRFSGYAYPDRVKRKEAKLLKVLRENNVQVTSPPFLMRYNDPATPPYLRRNEVAVEVQ